MEYGLLLPPSYLRSLRRGAITLAATAHVPAIPLIVQGPNFMNRFLIRRLWTFISPILLSFSTFSFSRIGHGGTTRPE